MQKHRETILEKKDTDIQCCPLRGSAISVKLELYASLRSIRNNI